MRSERRGRRTHRLPHEARVSRNVISELLLYRTPSLKTNSHSVSSRAHSVAIATVGRRDGRDCTAAVGRMPKSARRMWLTTMSHHPATKIIVAFRDWLRSKLYADEQTDYRVANPSPQIELYRSLIDVLRDQIAAQTDSAASNDLQCVALIAADLALIVGLLIIRASAINTSWGSWWWIPLVGLAVTALPFVVPVLPGSRRTGTFKDGPSIPDFLRAISRSPKTPEDTFLSLIKDLQHSWDANDVLAKRGSADTRGCSAPRRGIPCIDRPILLGTELVRNA